MLKCGAISEPQRKRAGVGKDRVALPFCHIAPRARKPPCATYPKELKTLGDHLRRRRLDLKLFQRDVARRLDVNEATTYNWENSRTLPRVAFVPRIIAFLGYVPYRVPSQTLGERIVAFRRVRGLTQNELALRLGVDPSTLGRWERDKGQPSGTLLGKLVAFEVL